MLKYKLIILFVSGLFIINPSFLAESIHEDEPSVIPDTPIPILPDDLPRNSLQMNDIDPLVNLAVTVHIDAIRALDPIDKHTDPDFFVKVFINGEEFKSPTWKNQKYLTDLDWSCTADVPDDEEFVEIVIQLWDWNFGLNTMCDIAYNDNWGKNRKDISMSYSLIAGHWVGDDFNYVPPYWGMDLSGYGRANGCDDNSIYQEDKDCELYFSITQTDYDNDGIPYATEKEFFNTDPTVDDRGRDDDNDGVPIEWEWKWGHTLDWQYDHDTDEWELTHRWFYDPFEYNDHETLDPDNDGIENIEEYLTSHWGSDPFRDDLFVELDQVDAGPNRQQSASILPEGSKMLITDAFHRQNVVFHLDDGKGKWEGQSGSEMIPFNDDDEPTDWQDVNRYYNNYFLHGNTNNWRKGVFHYGLVTYDAEPCGYAFRNNAFQIAQLGMEKKVRTPGCGSRDVVYASAYMHELGHTLGLVFLGGHHTDAYYFWQPAWWKWRPYRSVMNYGYMYGFLHDLVDFSDGSRGKNDFDDWANLDLQWFQY